MKPEKPLKTKRLVIAPMTGDDMTALIAEQTDEHMKNAYGEMLSLTLEHPESAEWYVCRRIALRDGTAIGDLCFKGPPDAEGSVEIGYGIDEVYRRKGYAAEAVSAAIDWAFEHADVKFVTAETEPDNAASQGLLKKLEFVPCGEGVEGPRFRKARPAMSWIPIGMCFGVALGTALGNILNNTSLWLSLGLCFGVLFGLIIDNSHKASADGSEDGKK